VFAQAGTTSVAGGYTGRGEAVGVPGA
jgi:hypothetical protein